MKELVLNDACPENDFDSVSEALDAVIKISEGVATLVNDGLVTKAIRLSKPAHEYFLTDELTLYSAILSMLQDPQHLDRGRFFAELTHKTPIDVELLNEEYIALVEWRLSDYPDCLALLLCAMSGRISVSASRTDVWRVDLLHLTVELDTSDGGEVLHKTVENLFSSESAGAVRQRLLQSELVSLSASAAWTGRERIFPRLRFAPSVEANFYSLSEAALRATLERLFQLNADVEHWRGKPIYSCKVTGESTPTMQKFGRFRQFTGPDGEVHVYELHARLLDGFRVHFRELLAEQMIEIGYVGPHLRTVKFPD